MRVGERILSRLSRNVDASDYEEAVESRSLERALDDLHRDFPGLGERVQGRRVLDFGCGSGRQTIGLALLGAREAVGLDTNTRVLHSARDLAHRTEGITDDHVSFVDELTAGMQGSFDVVISKDSMEHFADPAAVLAQMKRLLAPGGQLLIAFGPPWYSPYGSHMHFFTRVPWVHLLFAERTVMSVRGQYRSDGAERYEEVESGLNRMSIARFERLIRESGLSVLSRRYRCVRGLPCSGLPVMRELLVNHVSCVLVARGA